MKANKIHKVDYKIIMFNQGMQGGFGGGSGFMQPQGSIYLLK